jgi:hypothetical protein
LIPPSRKKGTKPQFDPTKPRKKGPSRKRNDQAAKKMTKPQSDPTKPQIEQTKPQDGDFLPPQCRTVEDKEN